MYGRRPSEILRDAMVLGGAQGIDKAKTRYELETVERYKRCLLNELHLNQASDEVMDAVLRAMDRLALITYQNIVANNLY